MTRNSSYFLENPSTSSSTRRKYVPEKPCHTLLRLLEIECDSYFPQCRLTSHDTFRSIVGAGLAPALRASSMFLQYARIFLEAKGVEVTIKVAYVEHPMRDSCGTPEERRTVGVSKAEERSAGRRA